MWGWEKLNGLIYVVAKVGISYWEILTEFCIKIIPTFHFPLPPPLQIVRYRTYASVSLLPP